MDTLTVMYTMLEQSISITNNLFVRELVVIDEESRQLYEQLVTIWMHMDDTLWSSLNIFLLTQGILFAGIAVLFDKEKMIENLPQIIACAGVVISFMWLFVSGRRRQALILIEHQCRHLEAEMLDGRKNDVEKYFPMYFTAARAVFLNYKHQATKRDERDDAIYLHHMESLRKERRFKRVRERLGMTTESNKPIKLMVPSRLSSIGIITLWMPILFIAIWAALFVLIR